MSTVLQQTSTEGNKPELIAVKGIVTEKIPNGVVITFDNGFIDRCTDHPEEEPYFSSLEIGDEVVNGLLAAQAGAGGVSIVGEVTPFAREHLSGFFTLLQKCLMGVLADATRKTILHGTNPRCICQVLQTSQNLRRIQPIIALIDGEVCELNCEPFWVPLRATDKSRFFKERQRKKSRGFRQPCWTGEPRPFGARQVRLRSNVPSADYLRYLVTKLGYRGDAAIAALVSDRQTSISTYGTAPFSPPDHPYRPASPTLPTTTGGGFKKQRVTEEIAKHNWNDKTNTAVFEIVYMRREPSLVAASLGLKPETVYRYCSHVRAGLRRGSAPKEPSEIPKLHAKNSKSFVFSKSVLIYD